MALGMAPGSPSGMAPGRPSGVLSGGPPGGAPGGALVRFGEIQSNSLQVDG
jgi:hypothetical protein